MPNILDGNGLQVIGLTEAKQILETMMRSIYGENINLDQNSPDAQLINILAQMITDYGELIQDVYASIDPDQAYGNVLDQRAKINGVYRSLGTRSTVTLTVNATQSLTIKGYDEGANSIDDCFQVTDSSGNVLVPQTTTNLVSGANTVIFIAEKLGALDFPANSVNQIKTTTIGVTSVNNTTKGTIGLEEESDSSLRIRRNQAASALSAFGSSDALYSALYNTVGVKFANIIENTSNLVDLNNIPPQGIWVIVQKDDSVTDETIANIIYSKRILGTPMKQDATQYGKSYNITRPNGEIFTAYWSRPQEQLLYINIDCYSSTSIPLEADVIKNIIMEKLELNVGKSVDSTTITVLLKNNIPNIIIRSLTVSQDGQTYESMVTPKPNVLFYLTLESIAITI